VSRSTTSRIGSIGLLAVALVGSSVAVSPAFAQQPQPPAKKELSEADLQRLRDLFNEAFQDEQAGRYQQALDKFKRIAQDRESASVRYRIATNLANLKRLKEARDMFRGLAASSIEDVPDKEKPIVADAAKRVPELDKKIPKLVVKIDKPPADARITVDGAPVLEGRPVDLDPGEHLVHVSSAGTKPFDGKVTLNEGDDSPYPVTLESLGASGNGSGNGNGRGNGEDPAPRSNTVAYIALAGGGALIVTGVVLLIAREGAISNIEDNCPNGNCDLSKKDEIISDRDRAKLFEPLGIGFAAVGVVAAGFGAYMLFRPSSPAPAPNGPGKSAPPAGSGATVHVGPRAVNGGVLMGVGGTF
jgi:hypothetical protein